MKLVHTAGRALLSGIFVSSGARALTNPDMFVPTAKRFTDRVAPVLEKADPRLPTETRTLVQVNAAAQLAGGLLLVTPLRRPAALMLAASLVPTTLAAHPFWEHDDPSERSGHQVHFLKNLGLLGGLLLAATDTEGKPGLGWRAKAAGRRAKASARRARRVGSRSLKRLQD